MQSRRIIKTPTATLEKLTPEPSSFGRPDPLSLSGLTQTSTLPRSPNRDVITWQNDRPAPGQPLQSERRFMSALSAMTGADEGLLEKEEKRRQLVAGLEEQIREKQQKKMMGDDPQESGSRSARRRQSAGPTFADTRPPSQAPPPTAGLQPPMSPSSQYSRFKARDLDPEQQRELELRYQKQREQKEWLEQQMRDKQKATGGSDSGATKAAKRTGGISEEEGGYSITREVDFGKNDESIAGLLTRAATPQYHFKVETEEPALPPPPQTAPAVSVPSLGKVPLGKQAKGEPECQGVRGGSAKPPKPGSSKPPAAAGGKPPTTDRSRASSRAGGATTGSGPLPSTASSAGSRRAASAGAPSVVRRGGSAANERPSTNRTATPVRKR